MSEFLKVGQIVSTFGLRGQVKVQPLTDFTQRLDKGQKVILKEKEVLIEACSWQKKHLLVKLAGVTHIDQAKALQWEFLTVPAGEEVELDEDEFMVSDLEGMKVVTSDGQELGKVNEVAAYPAQDILVIGELMIPLVKEFVKDIDMNKRVITVELLEGMLDPGTE